jgi:hypothetical protein
VLTNAVEATESLAAVDMRCFVQAEAKPISVAVVRAMALSYQMVVGVIEEGLLAEELQQSAPDLLVRYAHAVDAALTKAKQIRAVLVAGIANFVGERQHETLEARLTRAAASVEGITPIDLGDFTQYVQAPEAAG